MNNPAALQGWVKSTDPKSGRVFYANHITRKTQWEPPADWVETAAPPSLSSSRQEEGNEAPLPSNWQVMHDPTTGKPFYVDHERKITTWTRPTVASSSASSANRSTQVTRRTAPAQAAFVPTVTQQPQFDYQYHQQDSHHSILADFSDALPPLDFAVETIPDAARDACAHCSVFFRATKRRHHCRLCGDIFCDACSSHRTQLPLEGPQYAKPVRLCDACQEDVDQGNFFSWRRYLTPLLLVAPGDKGEDQVQAALSAMSVDVTQQMQNPSGGNFPPLLEKIVELLIPHCHLKYDTSARAVVALAACIAWEAVLQKTKLSVLALPLVWEALLEWLERGSTDRKTLLVQELAARTLCHLTEPHIVRQLNSDASLPDLSRAMRNLIDHLNSPNPQLQRWAAATLSHLIRWDQELSLQAINEVAAYISVQQSPPDDVRYESFVQDLVQSGGILILTAGMTCDDADTRAHALAALGGLLQLCRTLDAANVSLFEMSGGFAGNAEANQAAAVLQSIVAGGALSAVAQLLLSADHSVATLGCQFANSCVGPVLTDPRAATISVDYDYRHDNSAVGACRQAAVELIKSGNTLPALLSLTNTNRPIQLRQLAAETLAAVTLGVADMGRVASQGQYEQGLEKYAAPGVASSIMTLVNESVLQRAVEWMQGGSLQLAASKGQQDTPSMRIKEAASTILGALTSCSAESILTLQSVNLSQWNADPSPSSWRGDASPKGLGLLECMGNCLLFAWQHNSGAQNQLLDQLLQVVDAGLLETLSRVLQTQIEWGTVTSVGAIKAKTAACRLLCCCAGIALDHQIAMQRFMQALEADARQNYNKGKHKGQPNNLIEACLACLQSSCLLGRKSLLGQAQLETYHQAALLEAVDAALLAAGSLCGSNVPPVTTEGTFISGEEMSKPRQDAYLQRRQEICKVACQVVTRNTNDDALLPTLLVGGLGAHATSSSLRLSLAICANGTSEQHERLGQSGILVPVSDSLQAALQQGNIYEFSAALTIVRFCGPYASSSDSVKQAIRIATNVMHLPLNPSATPQQAAKQAALKAECVAAVESLSRNPSLFSSISQDALPAITASINSSDPASQKASLRALLPIVEVPSHAVAAAQSGLLSALSQLIRTTTIARDEEIPMLALEILHAISKHAQQLFVEHDIVTSICSALGASATDTPKKPSDPKADVTFLGLEILHGCLQQVQGDYMCAEAMVLVDAVAGEASFVNALCATLLVSTQMKIPEHDDPDTYLPVPQSYGMPLILVPETCAGFENTHQAAIAFFWHMCVACCMIPSQRSDAFWSLILHTKNNDAQDAVTTFCAHFLKVLQSSPPFVTDSLTKPLVCHNLLERLRIVSNWSEGSYLPSVLVAFDTPSILLNLWADDALQDLCYHILQAIMEKPSDILHAFLPAVVSLLDLLASTVDSTKKQFLASIVAQLAESGLLSSSSTSVPRDKAIKALSAACMSEHDVAEEEDDAVTGARLSTVLLQCLVDFCEASERGLLTLTTFQATQIAKDLGPMMSRMVVSRFLERARLRQYDLHNDEDDILEAPDVQLLVSVAQYKEALQVLRRQNGLHAVSLIASEGQVAALEALQRACQDDPTVLLEGDMFGEMLRLIAAEEQNPVSAMHLLASLCRNGGSSRVAAHAHSLAAIERAVDIIVAVVDSRATPDDEGKVMGDALREKENKDETQDDLIEKSPFEEEEPSLANEQVLRKLDKKEIELVVASCSFLAALAPKLEDHHSSLMPILASMIQNEDLQFEALQLLSALSPYAKNVDGLTKVLLAILKPPTVASTVVAAASQGLARLWDGMSLEHQKEALDAACKHFGRVVKFCFVNKDDFSEASYHLTALMTLGRGSLKDVLNPQTEVLMMNFLQWRFDPKTEIKTPKYWDAAVSNVLFLLSTVVTANSFVGMPPLMLSRPGKVPRKAIAPKAVLTKLAESLGPYAVPAQVILERLG
ncbi:RUN and FYVE domain-containing protein 1 [Fistulifera solaris]|uniref:RUN and FYVE domain-containing protein 1 n=1 Tax=Fistulifera solaris TaxID=1519565 RepID=A0A1Z5KHW1_FISSO|nr:RUN and FYVE domain-containing protein 1 [Fistulifera solaris]|eukprot:GAX25631.1 RUN and FYVE domain-containing protein 1 [Fistulifera solaris]